MDWPPQVGELLPRAEDAVGVREKLESYSLNISHPDGGPKAQGFEEILGITIGLIDYLESEIRRAIQIVPVSAVRNNPPYGVNCVVEFPLRGVGARGDRLVRVKTIWLLAKSPPPPRLVSAYPRP